MSHHVYTTRGIVLSLKPTKEADKVVSIFTRSLGLIYGTARGVRKLNSKTSPSLLELAIVKVSLIRGRGYWRVTSVSLLNDSTTELRGERAVLAALYRIAALLQKLIRGEESNPELYDAIEQAMFNIFDKKFNQQEVENWELCTVAKILSHLGYLAKEEVPVSLEAGRQQRERIITLVNSGIHESALS